MRFYCSLEKTGAISALGCFGLFLLLSGCLLVFLDTLTWAIRQNLLYKNLMFLNRFILQLLIMTFQVPPLPPGGGLPPLWPPSTRTARRLPLVPGCPRHRIFSMSYLHRIICWLFVGPRADIAKARCLMALRQISMVSHIRKTNILLHFWFLFWH